MDFCLTNNLKIVNSKHYTNNIKLTNGFTLFYNDKNITVKEDNNYIQIFSGIIWDNNIDYVLEKDVVYNGQFYSVVYEKCNETVRVVTDFKEDFPVFYCNINDSIVVTTRLLTFKYGRFVYSRKWMKTVYDTSVIQTEYIEQPKNSIASQSSNYHNSMF